MELPQLFGSDYVLPAIIAVVLLAALLGLLMLRRKHGGASRGKAAKTAQAAAKTAPPAPGIYVGPEPAAKPSAAERKAAKAAAKAEAKAAKAEAKAAKTGAALGEPAESAGFFETPEAPGGAPEPGYAPQPGYAPTPPAFDPTSVFGTAPAAPETDWFAADAAPQPAVQQEAPGVGAPEAFAGAAAPAMAAAAAAAAPAVARFAQPGTREGSSFATDPLRGVLTSILQGWGDLTTEDTNRLEVFRRDKVLAAIMSVELPKDLKGNEYARTRLTQLKRYAAYLEQGEPEPAPEPMVQEFAGIGFTPQASSSLQEGFGTGPDLAPPQTPTPPPLTEAAATAAPVMGAAAGVAAAVGVAAAAAAATAPPVPETPQVEEAWPVEEIAGFEDETLPVWEIPATPAEPAASAPAAAPAQPAAPSPQAVPTEPLVEMRKVEESPLLEEDDTAGFAWDMETTEIEEEPVEEEELSGFSWDAREPVPSEPLIEPEPPAQAEPPLYAEPPAAAPQAASAEPLPTSTEAAVAAAAAAFWAAPEAAVLEKAAAARAVPTPPEEPLSWEPALTSPQAPAPAEPSPVSAMRGRISTAAEVLGLPAGERADMLAFLQPLELSKVFQSTDDRDLKKSVIDTLEHVGSTASLDAIHTCLDDPDPEIQLYALDAADRLLGTEGK